MSGKFTGWLCDGNGEQFPIQIKVVIDASGVAGVASKILDLNPRGQVIAGMQYEMLKSQQMIISTFIFGLSTPKRVTYG